MRGKFWGAAGLSLLLTSAAYAQSTTSIQVTNGGGTTGPVTYCVVGTVTTGSCPMPVTTTGGGVTLTPIYLTPTNDSLSLTTGGTAQNAIASNATRKGCTIQNPATATDQGIATAENIYVNFGGTAAAASTSFELTPGQSISCSPLGIGTITSAVSVVAATTGHKIIAVEFN